MLLDNAMIYLPRNKQLMLIYVLFVLLFFVYIIITIETIIHPLLLCMCANCYVYVGVCLPSFTIPQRQELHLLNPTEKKYFINIPKGSE